MLKPKNYTIYEVFKHSLVGFIFDFFSTKNVELLVADISSIIKDKVFVLNSSSDDKNYNYDILFKEYDAEKPRFNLNLKKRNTIEAEKILTELIHYLNDNCTFDFSTRARVNLSFDHSELKTINEITHINPGKLILKIDENFIHEKFEEFKDSPFSKSVKNITPINNFILPNEEYLINNLHNTFNLPIASYYGIDLTKYMFGEIGFNYIGGRNYSAKPTSFIEVLEYYILATYKVLNDIVPVNEYMFELDKMLNNYKKLWKYYYTPLDFIKDHPDIQIYKDLKNKPEIIQASWPDMRGPIFNLLYQSDIGKAMINYDSNLGIFQIKNANIKNATIDNFNFIRCELENCVIINSELWRTKANKCRIIDTTLVSSNNVADSKLERVRADRSNRLENVYVYNENRGDIINCKIINSFVKYANIGDNASVDEYTIIIGKSKPKYNKREPLKVKSTRDYKWMKDIKDANDMKYSPGYLDSRLK